MTIYCLHARAVGAAGIVPLTLRDPDSDPLRLAYPTGAGATLMTGRRERRGEWLATPKLGVTVILEDYLDIEVDRAAPARRSSAAGPSLI
jgi:hypothetical protein